MIDTHCHLLPGIDDGAANEQETLQMVQIAIADGIEQIIVTPHQLVDRYENLNSSFIDLFNQTRHLIEQQGLKLKIHRGAEVHYSSVFWEKEELGEITTLAGTRFILIEFAPRVLPRIIEGAIEKLVARGYKPIIAHPERIPAFDLDSPLIENLKSIGGYFQITAHSIDGTFGAKMQRYAKKWVLSNNCHLVGSDAHNIGRRPPKLKAAFASIRKWTKSPLATEIIQIENTNRLLHDERLIETSLEKKKWFTTSKRP